MNLPKVVVAHFDDNVKSALIVKKLGFQETGRFVVKHRIIVGYEQLNPNHHSL
jgi:RimJ/RimL family protein N-acetyltransferase